MNPIFHTRYWFELALFLVLGFVSIGIPIIPMGLAANSWSSPDLMFPLFAAWIIRHPETAPVLAVVFLAIIAEAMMMKPIGLWAFVMLLSTEILRVSIRAFRDIPFVLEWVYVAGFFLGVTILQNVILFISFDDVYGFYDQMWHVLRTIAVYPIVVAVLHFGFRIRIPKVASGSNRLGQVS